MFFKKLIPTCVFTSATLHLHISTCRCLFRSRSPVAPIYLPQYTWIYSFGSWQQLFGRRPLQAFRELVAFVLMVSVLVSWWSLNNVSVVVVSWWHFCGVSVVSWRCSVIFWVFCSCFGGVSVVFWRCSGGVLVVSKEWHFFDQTVSPVNTKLLSKEMRNFAI